MDFDSREKLAERISSLVFNFGRIWAEPYFEDCFVFSRKSCVHKIEVVNDRFYWVIDVFRFLQEGDNFERVVDWLNNSNECNPDSTDDLVRYGSRIRLFFNKNNQFRLRNYSSFSRVFCDVEDVFDVDVRMVPEEFKFFYERFMFVQIDCCDPLYFIKHWDSDGTVFYVDCIEPTDSLIEALSNVKGSVIVSGSVDSIFSELTKHGFVSEALNLPCGEWCLWHNLKKHFGKNSLGLFEFDMSIQ